MSSRSSQESPGFSAALLDFQHERDLAALEAILAHLTGRSADLLSFDEVSRSLRIEGGSEKGLQDIPIQSIVGSVGRYADFSRSFLPRRQGDGSRWARVKAILVDPGKGGLPPIEVYKIGEAYFVRDGHHRVSVARQLGFKYIQAYVTEIRTKVALTADVTPDELILKSEYADFLAQTHFDEIVPEVELRLTVPGMYRVLAEHIAVHRYFMGLDLKRDISYEEAVQHWYHEVYLPVVEAIRERGILRDFPGRSETDLYVWISRQRYALEQEMGWRIRPEVVASSFAYRQSPRLSRVFQRVKNRLLDILIPDELEDVPNPGQWYKEKAAAQNLFADILVPLSGQEESWSAMEQAVIFARREGAQLLGLQILKEDEDEKEDVIRIVQERFDRRCQEEGISGSLAREHGEVARKICERALLTDLVVLSLAHPPAAQIAARLESGFRTIVRRCAQPILAVPGKESAFERLLVAFDGSVKAKEALTIAGYLAGKYKASLSVLTVSEAGRTTNKTLRCARDYLDAQKIQAEYLEKTGPVSETILRTVEEGAYDAILMGGYGFSPMMELMLGSSLDQVLRESRVPILICQ